jgi:hypothetical protein
LDTLKTELALDALEMALWARKDRLSTALVHHGDRGVQYTSIRYSQRLIDAGIERSVGREGDSYDNVLEESVNALYKKEVIVPEGPWNDAAEVTLATSRWVFWYNHERLHSWCGDVPPMEFEEAFWQGGLAQPPAAKACTHLADFGPRYSFRRASNPPAARDLCTGRASSPGAGCSSTAQDRSVASSSPRPRPPAPARVYAADLMPAALRIATAMVPDTKRAVEFYGPFR